MSNIFNIFSALNKSSVWVRGLTPEIILFCGITNLFKYVFYKYYPTPDYNNINMDIQENNIVFLRHPYQHVSFLSV